MASPLALRDISTDLYTVSRYDSDVVLRFFQNGTLNIPSDEEGRFPIGMQFAVESLVGTVATVPDGGVFVIGSDRTSIRALRTAVFTHTEADTWLMSLSEGTKTDGTTPDPPKLTAVTPGGGKLTLTWTAPADDGGHTISSYVAEYSTDQKTWIAFATQFAGTARTGAITGLTMGTTYYARLRAVNVKGPSDPSNVMSGVPTQPFNNASGGNSITYYMLGQNKWRLHRFTASGTFTVSETTNLPWKILTVGGGATDGGGGAVVEQLAGAMKVGAYAVTVAGTGGVTLVKNPDGTDFQKANPGQGGCGGCGNTCPGGVPGGGYRGPTVCGGPNDRGGDGGNGTQSTVEGTATWYGGGGGGVCYNCLDSYPGRGGLGGGGKSGSGREGPPEAGKPNSGGGGGAQQGGNPGAGGTGVVLFAYQVDPATPGEVGDPGAPPGEVDLAHVDPVTNIVFATESANSLQEATRMVGPSGVESIRVPYTPDNPPWVGRSWDERTGKFEQPVQHEARLLPMAGGDCGGCLPCQ